MRTHRPITGGARLGGGGRGLSGSYKSQRSQANSSDKHKKVIGYIFFVGQGEVDFPEGSTPPLDPPMHRDMVLK